MRKKKGEEATIRDEILYYLLKTGWFARRTNQPTHRLANQSPFPENRGEPDIDARKIAVPRRGEEIQLEVKTPKGKLSPSQEIWHHGCREAGGIVLVVTSVEDTDSQLLHLGFIEQSQLFS